MTTAAELLRGVGLLADGPVMWGQRVGSRRPGVFFVELPAPLATAPIDAAVCGKWIERVPTFRIDGEVATGAQLVRRLASFWLPSETILYTGATTRALGGRIGALYATPLGDRRPHPGGHWLKTLRGIEQLRVWWAETDAPAEAELELAIAFAEAVNPEEVGHLPDPKAVMPFANLEDPLGVRKPHGLNGTLLAAEPEPASAADATPGSMAASSAGAADVGAPGTTRAAGTRGAGSRGDGSAGRARTPASTAGRTAAAGTGSATRAASTRGRALGGRLRQSVPPKPASPPGETVHVTAAGLERLQGELDELLGRRPGVISRIRSARELGDLRENSEYQEARREQSFLEGRIQAIEATLRAAVVVENDGADDGDGPDRVRMGSTVVLELHDDTATYTLVGPREANAGAGRISTAAPIGQALLGRRTGDEIAVATPAGERLYRILGVTNE